MRFDYAYNGSSNVSNQAGETGLSFAPDLKREPTFFRGELKKSIAFREAISALHHVVVSDLRWKPKDRTVYLAWAAKQEEEELRQLLGENKYVEANIRQEILGFQDELRILQRAISKRMAPFYSARAKYYDYLYKKDRDAWYVLDPVITVHPDEIFFECFSQDESSYGRLSAGYDVFENMGEFACGTTNVDYSQALYDEFQKIRSYKTTTFEVDPSGFNVETSNEESYKEVKIDLPESWVRGFLQVNSAMTLPSVSFRLHPMDIYNICWLLRRRKEKQGPRSMRYILEPGQPIKIIFEPWNYELVCSRSPYEGDKSEDIRVWGRRRIHILERLIQSARSFTVHLLGTGMPSFYVVDLGDMSFTLGLSGWTKNDWAASGNFDLMAPRAQTDELTKKRVFEGLKESWFNTPDALAKNLDLDRSTVLGALSSYAQAGSAIYDLNKDVYRVRELSREPLPMDKLRFSNEREKKADRFLARNDVKLTKIEERDGVLSLKGSVSDGRTYNPALQIDSDQRIISGECNCSFYKTNKLFKGPCEHILSLRLKFNRDKK